MIVCILLCTYDYMHVGLYVCMHFDVESSERRELCERELVGERSNNAMSDVTRKSEHKRMRKKENLNTPFIYRELILKTDPSFLP